ncbi:NAD(P)H-hydrate dehydratase [Microbacterium sp. MEC084]|uniref:ADP-dependent NAD(P)H-hydrate dehydratase n=1 Tax=Microbacterium sp. MEC084 TaxID=1963027 RepID=UPI0010702587|nr:ADP/ATP-dependent (S)-NAD(P)H-hydrate dehydratase [Microbacterium sp. MEC084]MCD1268354.1 NAD(P)H-hydrate dehydratase [Microbacterium sp. MEC084]
MTVAREWTAADTAAVLRVPTGDAHKYSRGVVGLRTGAPTYPGAAVLTAEGAARAGAGMVRWLGDAEVARLVMQRRPEVVTTPGRVDAWAVGSGTDPDAREPGEAALLREILVGDAPVVVDAGALDLVADATAPLIVTPHAGEFAKLRASLGLDGPAEDVGAVAETAAALGGVVLRKGSETVVATPSGVVRAVRAGTPWLATAGTGDVLAGALGALVAAAAAEGPVGAEELGALAAAAAWLHGAAGRLAAGVDGEAPGHPITALDVAEHLPAAFALALSA